MPDKGINRIFTSLWVVFVLITGWRCEVSHGPEEQQGNLELDGGSGANMSSFSGLLGGVINMGTELPVNMAFVGAGLCGAMGGADVLLGAFLWEAMKTSAFIKDFGFI